MKRLVVNILITGALLLFSSTCFAQSVKGLKVDAMVSGKDTIPIWRLGDYVFSPGIIRSGQENVPEFIKKALGRTDQAETNADATMEIDGLIVDETRTRAGRDFYEIFFSKWEPPPSASNYTIRITERPYRMRMSLLSITINDDEVVKTPLQPRYEIVTVMAEKMVKHIYDYLLEKQKVQQQLEQEDQTGSGLF